MKYRIEDHVAYAECDTLEELRDCAADWYDYLYEVEGEIWRDYSYESKDGIDDRLEEALSLYQDRISTALLDFDVLKSLIIERDTVLNQAIGSYDYYVGVRIV